MKTWEALKDLTDRVVAGKVTFFIGAGFSVDSEGNTARQLIARLLARFASITDSMIEEDRHQDKARSLREIFEKEFFPCELKWGDPENLMADKNIEKIAAQYYIANDLFCSAFSEIAKLHSDDKKEIKSTKENEYLSKYKNNDKSYTKLLKKISQEILHKTENDAGKALFLDTMGFNDEQVMAGKLFDCTLDKTAECINRLYPRHFVLAKLAMEGWLPQLLTSNYDLLLDSAYRLAGMELENNTFKKSVNSKNRHSTRSKKLNSALMNAISLNTVASFRRIAAPADFFEQGNGHRSALLVKIHGCVERYRMEKKNSPQWEKYLPAMVFTFREIQNWRKDSWSRDLLRTLIRTRTMAFCGYSAQDPVIHDTVRSVYEEMATQTDTTTENEVPAFFFGEKNNKNFHGTEILRAAARAVGQKSFLTSQSNLIEFEFLKDSKKGKFSPNIDQLLRWLLHQCLRRRQMKTLETHLPLTAQIIFGKLCRQQDIRDIQEKFKLIIDSENHTNWSKRPDAEREFDRHCGWTENFHFALLRQWKVAEVLKLSQGPDCFFRFNWDEPGISSWYCPMLDHPIWTAWATILEIAIRNLHDKNSPERVRPVVSGVAAAVDISPTNKSIHTPIQLRIELGKPYKTYLYNNRPLRNIFCWDLDINTIPWGESSNLPSPKSIWHLALDRTITPADPLLSDIKKCLEGITSEKQNSQ